MTFAKPFISTVISILNLLSTKVKPVLLVLLIISAATDHLFAQADWAYLGPNGKLVYKTDVLGNRIIDFSHAGYMGGGVAIPDVPVKVTLQSNGGDQTAAIQAAIDQVSALPLVDGFRGTVLLGTGTFNISAHIYIRTSGVVLRGSGMGTDGTIIQKASSSPTIRLEGVSNQVRSNKVNITDTLIHSGAYSFNVADASAFQVGEQVVVNRVVTAAWVKYVKMDSLYRNGAKQTWHSVGATFRADRIIKAISGNTITLDVPLIDSYDSKYLGTPVASIEKYTFPGRITQVGLENLQIKGPYPGAGGHAIDVFNVIDGWVRNVHCIEGRNTVNAFGGTKRFTFDHVIVTNPIKQTNSAAPEDFQIDGATQILFNKCEAHTDGDWGFLTQSGDTGPFVILNCRTDHRGVNPHQRWTVGILADGGSFGGSTGVDWVNRKTAGSGHGWTTGWSVAWNVTTPKYTNEAAPGSMNWVVGGTGSLNSTSQPKGITDHLGTLVKPTSLYLQQLLERLGPQALYNIGYTPFDAVRTLEVKITSPQNGASFPAPANINIGAQSSDETHGVTKVEFYNGSTKLGEDLTSPYNFSWTNVPVGVYTLTSNAINGIGKVVSSAPVTVTVFSQGPYLGIVRSIPGKIEAEDYDEGGQGVAFNETTSGNNYKVYRFENVDIQPCGDVGGGFNVALVATGEWVEYTVKVEAGGTYQLDLRVAATTSTRALHVEMDGVNITGRVAVPNTGAFQVYKTVSIITPILTAGKKVMRVHFETPSHNLNWLMFTIQRRTQTITFNDIEDVTYGDPPFQVGVSADSGLPVSLEVVSGPVVLEDGLLKITGTGEVKLRANQTGNADYFPATAEKTFVVHKAEQTVTFNTIETKTYGDASFELQATVDSGLPLTFEIISGPATISETTVTITGAGEVAVRVSQEGNENYLPAMEEQTFTVNKSEQAITFEAVLPVSQSDIVELHAAASSGLPVTFEVISGHGALAGHKLAFTGEGEVVVEATQAGDENYLSAAPVQQMVLVYADDSKYDAIKLHVHPNPTKWKLKVKLENKKDKDYTFVIYDRFGQPIASSVIAKSHKMFEVDFDMSGADEGMYYLWVSDGTDVTVRRIIKE